MKKHIFPVILISASLILLSGCVSQPEKAETKQETDENSALALVQAGRIDDAKKLFQTQADINAVDENGNTVLHLAALKNDADLVSFLISKGADTSLKNYNSEIPLHVAIKHDSYDAARNLAASGSDIFTKDGSGTSALEMALSRSDIYYDIMITTRSGDLRDLNGESIVHYFVKTRNEKAIGYCVKKGLPLGIKDKNGITPLAIALKNADDPVSVRIAAELLKAGTEPVPGDYSYFEETVLSRNMSLRFDGGQTALHIAAANGQNGIAEYLVENGASVSAQDTSGATPLHEAVRYGYSDIATLLLEHGADVNATDTLGKTPLLLIIPKKQQEQMYNLLLSNKADTKSKDMYGDTVLHVATMMGIQVTVLEQMVKYGADINARNKQGVTPLSVAIEHKLDDHIKFYVQNNADINAEDVQGRTPLTQALASGQPLVEKIVTAGNINSHDSEGNTPLHTAILKDAPLEMIQYMLSLNGDINMRNSTGDSPLYLAIQKNRRDIGELLLSKDANIFSTNTHNDSPLRLALTRGGDVSDWILTSKTINATDGSGNTALHYAAEWGLEPAVTTILEKGADPDKPNANGETALFNAAKTDDTKIIDLLIKGGATKTVRDHLGSTPLHTAGRWNSVHSAQRLIDIGLDINAQNTAGMTPLAEAALSGKKEMTQLLLENGANPNVADATGRTILIDAIRSQNQDVITLMLDAGANPNIQGMDGKNASHEAVLTGSVPIIEMIYKVGGNPLSRDTNGNTPFSLSLKQTETVIRAAAGKDRNITDSDGNTIIHIAVQNDIRPDILTALLKDGYPADNRNAKGYTPLALAVSAGKNDIAEELLANGANPFITIDSSGLCPLTLAMSQKDGIALGYMVKYAGTKTDIKGNGILHYAAKTADADTVAKLIKAGLDRSIKNISGETAYDIAVNWQRPEIAQLLKN